ncbi:unnamed protein product [Owenia fusiformis]|uniref:Uncharacterized protein n=1 Tax=Owenia fusiformis TaxID=6347 RepID=A0A8J1XN39_OWEFU|nr:unnamed protein product [Owenia fusiformis]
MAFKCPPEALLRPLIRQGMNMVRNNSSSASGTYRAATVTELGKPLLIQNLPRKPLKKDQVRVAVKCCGINFGDILMTQGKYQEKFELPFTPGTETSGVVLEVGDEVKNVKQGDHVMGNMMGGFAEEVVVDSKMIWGMYPGMEFKTAASLVTSYGTAQMGLVRRANIQEGDVVLVTAAAGAVGLAAVDLAANVYNATVIGACGGPEKCELIKKFGAKYAIDYKKESIRERVKEITKGKGANIIFDAVGGDVFNECLRSIAFEGRIVVVGFASGEIPKIPANILLVKSCSAVGLYWGSYSQRDPKAFIESVTQCMALSASKTVTPHVSKTFPLEQVNEALLYVGNRSSTGKVVVRAGPEP